MEKEKLIHWCHIAAGQIRYKPDRQAVTLELYHHLEDRYDALIEKGIPADEAEQQALAAMGSAEEIAPQLAAIHKPWLGYLFKIVRGLALIPAALALFLAVANFVSFLHTLHTTRNFDSIPANHAPLVGYCHPKASAWCDGYRFEIHEAGYSPNDGALYFDLEMIYFPWQDAGAIVDHIWAVDSLGNYYDCRDQAEYTDDSTRVSYSSGMMTNGISIRSMVITGFDPDAQWVELRYDRDGRDLVLRIDLTGGGTGE